MEQLKVDYILLKEKHKDNVYAMNKINFHYKKFEATNNSTVMTESLKAAICRNRMSQLELTLKRYG